MESLITVNYLRLHFDWRNDHWQRLELAVVRRATPAAQLERLKRIIVEIRLEIRSIAMQRRMKWMAAAVFEILGLLIAGAGCFGAEAKTVTVFKARQNGYHTYRIPVIIRAKNGDLLVFAEGRKNSAADHGDIDIVMKRSDDDGKTWGPLELVEDEDADPTAKVWIGNPTPVVDQADPQHPGRIWLGFTRSNAKMFVASSDDNGKTWAKRRDITSGCAKPAWDWVAAGPVHGIQLERGAHAGRLVIPCDHQIKATGSWGVHLVYSDDHGVTWKLGAVDTRAADDPLHPNECVAVELADGRVYVNAREHNGSDPATRTIAYSSDGGQTFDAPFAAEPKITSPVVQNSLVRLTLGESGDRPNVLVYCGPGHPTERRDLTMLASYDEGKTWKRKTVVHAGPAAYSDLVKLDDEYVGVIFEAGRRLYAEILFAKVGLKDLANP
jgi:sialidase-1